MNPIMRYKSSKTKIGIFGILTKSQKGSILDHLRNLNKISTPFSESALKMALETFYIEKKKLHFPIKKSHIKAKIDQNYCSPENAI